LAFHPHVDHRIQATRPRDEPELAAIYLGTYRRGTVRGHLHLVAISLAFATVGLIATIIGTVARGVGEPARELVLEHDQSGERVHGKVWKRR